MSFPSHAVIITAAGSSTRFNEGHLELKKEFALLDDRSVLWHAANQFFAVPGMAVMAVMYQQGLRDETEAALDNLMFASQQPLILVQGGNTRQESVLLGLEALAGYPVQYVLIHDGARPWVTQQLIISTLATATVYGGAAPVLPVHDAAKRTDDEGAIVSHVERANLVTVQTPQAFRFPAILEAHRKAARTAKAYVDDTEVYTDCGLAVGTVQGDPANRKITVFDDLSRERP